ADVLGQLRPTTIFETDAPMRPRLAMETVTDGAEEHGQAMVLVMASDGGAGTPPRRFDLPLHDLLASGEKLLPFDSEVARVTNATSVSLAREWVSSAAIGIVIGDSEGGRFF